MDIRKTEKIIWGKIWQDLSPSLDNNDLFQHIKNYFIDMGYMRSSAQEKRFEDAVYIVMDKIWEKTPTDWRKRI